MEEGIEVMIGEAKRIFQFEQQVMEELQAEWVYIALLLHLRWWLFYHILVVMKRGRTLFLALMLGA